MKQKASPSRRDDRNTRLLVSHAAQRLPAFVDRPVRDGYSLKTLTQSGSCRILGYFRQVPAGLIFSNHQRTCTSLKWTRMGGWRMLNLFSLSPSETILQCCFSILE